MMEGMKSERVKEVTKIVFSQVSISLFNGISTLLGYSIPKPSLWNNSSDTI